MTCLAHPPLSWPATTYKRGNLTCKSIILHACFN
ncbi:hypothetical protein F383_04985 [Gossypium arboreum]|uniref:Uncharacterized protein n=1 Tax=Gossypium arboreum TaxID=29729 RepID=A0A0B0NKR0_GOSAR|nr:hypothetical protein F383_04985 [Gossypium arboreum]